MNEDKELARLEGFVSTLLDKFNNLQRSHKELGERLQRRDATIESLEDELATMKDERGEISSRVSGLIGQIEEWEAASGTVDDEGDGDKESSVQGSLFSIESSE